MRTVCFVVFATSVLFTASAATALTNEELYEWCKPFADSGFKSTSDGSLLCAAYIAGAIDNASVICDELEDLAKSNSSLASVRSFFGGKYETSNKALIQAYVNKMKNEPSRWKYNPSNAMSEVIREIATCE